MESDFSKINDFFKQLVGLRETVNIGDFFFLPHIAHINKMLANEVSEKHKQRTFEISLILTGKMIYTAGNKEILVQEGDIIIIPPNMKHYWRVLEKDSDVFGFMVNISKHGEGARRDISLFNNSIKNHHYHIKNFSNFGNIIKEIIKEAIEQKNACNAKVLSLVRISFVELIRELLPDFSKNISTRNFPPARGESTKDIVEMVYYYIQDNIAHPINLSQISNHIGLSIGHLNFLFKNETGITINQAIINRRMKWACRYLKQTDRQIKDIATMLGYQDVNYFYLQFKKKYGTTPSAYRHTD